MVNPTMSNLSNASQAVEGRFVPAQSWLTLINVKNHFFDFLKHYELGKVKFFQLSILSLDLGVKIVVFP